MSLKLSNYISHLNLFFKYWFKYGLINTIKKSLVALLVGDFFTKRRIELSINFMKLFNSTVKYGPFSGLKLQDNLFWGNADKAAILFGFYEKEILDEIIKVSRQGFKYFIDIGAADGYYVAGLLSKGLFERSICYEISYEGRELIRQNLLINNIDESLVEIKGKAEIGVFGHLSMEVLSNAVVLIDIEGFEFDILDEEALICLRQSIVFVELHPFLIKNGYDRLTEFLKVASKYFNLSFIKLGARDPISFIELENLNDNDRWLICSEGRGRSMQWIKLEQLH
jgi:hypothetical protein